MNDQGNSIRTRVAIIGGGSSTLPHKQNPAQAEIILDLFDFAAAMTRELYRQQRDVAAWIREWHAHFKGIMFLVRR